MDHILEDQRINGDAPTEEILALLLNRGATLNHCQGYDLSAPDTALTLLAQLTTASTTWGLGSRQQRFHHLFLKLSTEVNISRECWQWAAMMSLAVRAPLSPCETVCGDLGLFGTRVGYAFDDQTLLPAIFHLPQHWKSFFLLGDGQAVRTLTGVFTQQALLVIALLKPGTDGPSLGFMGLVESLGKNLEGSDWRRRISLIKSKPTLLHLACATGADVEMVKVLLDKGCDLDALDAQSFTPLAAAAFGGNLDVVKLLLDLGADPYFSAPTPTAPAPPDIAGDFLQPLDGQQLARCVTETLAQWDADSVLPTGSTSPFEIVRRRRILALARN